MFTPRSSCYIPRRRSERGRECACGMPVIVCVVCVLCACGMCVVCGMCGFAWTKYKMEGSPTPSSCRTVSKRHFLE